MFVAVALLVCGGDACAQGFLKKLGQSVKETAKETVSDVGKDVVATVADSSIVNQVADTTDISALLTPMSFTVKRVVDPDAAKNEDGTDVVKYILYDQDGKACAPETAKKLINNRLKQYGKILANVGKGAALGAGAALLGGEKKDIASAAVMGGVAGIVASGPQLKQIKTLNKSIKNYKKTVAAYQKTFTDEGLPIDASVDLTNVDGIDFTKSEVVTKPSAEVEAELLASKQQGESIEDFDIPDEL